MRRDASSDSAGWKLPAREACRNTPYHPHGDMSKLYAVGVTAIKARKEHLNRIGITTSSGSCVWRPRGVEPRANDRSDFSPRRSNLEAKVGRDGKD